MATDHDHFIGSSSRDGYNSICLIRFARRQSLRLRVAWRPLRSSSISFLSSNTDPLLLYGNQSEVRNHFAVIQFFNQRFFVHPSALIFFPLPHIPSFSFSSPLFFFLFFLKRMIDCSIKDRGKSVYNGKVTVDIQLFPDQHERVGKLIKELFFYSSKNLGSDTHFADKNRHRMRVAVFFFK